VLGEEGRFSGLFQLAGYRDPVLVSSTDSVGTKLQVAVLMDSYESLGEDLVNLNVGDILTSGAKPLFFLDYIAMEKLDTKAVEGLIKGIARACREAGCALIGGETAQMGGTYLEGAFDFVGFVVGVVERDAIIDGSSVRDGDVLLGLPSSGVHTNGMSLVRRVFRIDENPSVLRQHHPELGRTLGEELLAPHRGYSTLLDPVLPKLKAVAHITGGGIVENVPRTLPEGMCAAVRRGTWREHPIFWMLQEEGGVDTDEMFRVFNMGLGMVLAVSPDDASGVQAALPDAVVVGEVVRQKDDRRVIIENS
jgi:phosphoribosylformylglycinamidine cyclo-ligase